MGLIFIRSPLYFKGIYGKPWSRCCERESPQEDDRLGPQEASQNGAVMRFLTSSLTGRLPTSEILQKQRKTHRKLMYKPRFHNACLGLHDTCSSGSQLWMGSWSIVTWRARNWGHWEIDALAKIVLQPTSEYLLGDQWVASTEETQWLRQSLFQRH